MTGGSTVRRTDGLQTSHFQLLKIKKRERLKNGNPFFCGRETGLPISPENASAAKDFDSEGKRKHHPTPTLASIFLNLLQEKKKNYNGLQCIIYSLTAECRLVSLWKLNT